MSQTITLTITLEVPDGAQVAVTPPTPEVVAAVDVAGERRPRLAVTPDAPEIPRLKLGRTQKAFLHALAERHGRIADPKGFAGSRLCEIAGSQHGPGSGVIKRLDELGLVERTMPNPRRITRIVLTPAGWEAIGQTPPHSSTIDKAREKPTEPTEPERPAMPVLGPIERRPFDPDQIRADQADLD